MPHAPERCVYAPVFMRNARLRLVFFIMEKICGIYKITNPNGDIYIGQSRNIFSRFKEYESSHCKRQPRVYRSIEKYGYKNHKFEIVCECEEESLDELEAYYIKLFDSFETSHGMNLTSGGRMIRVSEDTKKKVSRAGIGRVRSEETKNKIRNGIKKVWSDPAYKDKMCKIFNCPEYREKKSKLSKESMENPSVRENNLANLRVLHEKMRGVPVSDETKKKISDAGRGKIISEETKQKISESLKGREFSEEHKKNLSEALKGERHPLYGKHLSEETKRKMSEARKGEKHYNYGKHRTEDVKKKLSEASKEWWKKKKQTEINLNN